MKTLLRTFRLPRSWAFQKFTKATDWNTSHLRSGKPERQNLRGAYFDSACLAGRSLVGADLTGASLANADLSNCDLTGARLDDAEMRGVQLQSATLRAASLRRVNLSDAAAQLADFSDADLTEAVVQRADLRGASLRGTQVCSATLRDAALVLADLSMTDLRYTDLTGADLTWAWNRAHVRIPFVPAIDACVLAHMQAAHDQVRGLDEYTVELAAESGAALASRFGTRVAAAMIYHASAGVVPDFYVDPATTMSALRVRIAVSAEAARA